MPDVASYNFLSSIQARHLGTKLPWVDGSLTPARNAFFGPIDAEFLGLPSHGPDVGSETEYILVRERGRTVGYLNCYEGASDTKSARQDATPIVAAELVDADTPLLELTQLLTVTPRLFAQDANGDVYVVTAESLDCLAVRLLLKTLVTEMNVSLLEALLASASQSERLLLKMRRSTRVFRHGIARSRSSSSSSRTRAADDAGKKPNCSLSRTSFRERILLSLAIPAIKRSLPFASRKSAINFFRQVVKLEDRLSEPGGFLPRVHLFTTDNIPNRLHRLMSRMLEVSEILARISSREEWHSSEPPPGFTFAEWHNLLLKFEGVLPPGAPPPCPPPVPPE